MLLRFVTRSARLLGVGRASTMVAFLLFCFLFLGWIGLVSW